MPKQKTHKGLKKRVKVTATGKIKHKRPGCGHLMSKKNAKRKRRLNNPAVMNKTMATTAKIELSK